jgi:hypothetical protein
MDKFEAVSAAARAQAWPAVRLRGQLVRSPFAGKVYESELVAWPLARTHEYTSLCVFENASQYPILLSPGQRDLWLSGLVTAARRQIPNLSLSVIRMAGGQEQLMAELLDKDVLLTHEPAAAAARAVAAGRTGVLEVWQDLRTDGIEEGANNIVLTMHGAESVLPFIALASRDPTLSTLADCSITEHGASSANA